MSQLFEYRCLTKERLDYILDNLKSLRVALLGDVCLDVYWKADMTKSEISRETPHFPLPIVEERMSPGAGGNVANNIAALGVKELNVISVIGNDWRGKELIRNFEMRDIDSSHIISSDDLITNAYCKPIRQGISDLEYEDPRLDFTNYSPLPQKEEDDMIKTLENISSSIDVLCVSDQFVYGCVTESVRDKLSELSQKGLTIIVDSRDRINLYKNVTIKPNEVEGCKAVYGEIDPRDATFEMQQKAAVTLSKRNNCNVCMTLGSKGCIYVDTDNNVSYSTTQEIQPPIDICGAGDTFLSAFTCAIAVGAKGYEAAAFANLASAITIRKIGMTGTANKEEIIKRYNELTNDDLPKETI